MKLEISPSILSADLANLGRDVALCEQAGADAIHIDVMDGRFVPAITFGPAIVAACKRITSLPLDVHLMVVEPEKHLERFVEAGADILTVHVETCPHIHGTLQRIHKSGVKAGVTFNPGTPLDAFWELAELADLVLIMSVNPGAGGQDFIARSVDRIRHIKGIIEEACAKTVIQVDGGMSAKTVARVVEAGASNIVAGSAVFNHPHGIVEAIRELRAKAV